MNSTWISVSPRWKHFRKFCFNGSEHYESLNLLYCFYVVWLIRAFRTVNVRNEIKKEDLCPLRYWRLISLLFDPIVCCKNIVLSFLFLSKDLSFEGVHHIDRVRPGVGLSWGYNGPYCLSTYYVLRVLSAVAWENLDGAFARILFTSCVLLLFLVKCWRAEFSSICRFQWKLKSLGSAMCFEGMMHMSCRWNFWNKSQKNIHTRMMSNILSWWLMWTYRVYILALHFP